MFPSLTGENTTLDGSTVRHGLVWIDDLVGILAVEEFLYELLNLGNASGSPNENDLVNLVNIKLGIFHNALDRLESLAEKVRVELLKFGPGQ
mmetsp:Transcript_20426/g.48237  ORF Transcript_20426/g.48237 Transcript_20426/m.48237 type:complete len:92 (-) Transcript_20426:748-1023(-)